MAVVVLEHCRVAPPPGSVAKSSLPLTFLDVMFLNFPHGQSLLFYELPRCSYARFKDVLIPDLKRSLSLALQHFFPLAGNLVIPPYNDANTAKPKFRYAEGDSIPLTFAESSSDFNHLTGNYERDVNEFYGLVPKIPQPNKLFKEDIEKVIPVVALQVTLFPNVGLCFGFTYDHVVCDGRSFSNFMRSWALISKLGDRDSEGGIGISLPVFDKTAISDPNGVENIFLKQLGYYSNNTEDQLTYQPHVITDKVRATFLLPGSDIQTLKELVLTRGAGEKLNHMSTFTVACAYIWVCWVRSSAAVTEDGKNDNELDDYFLFAADCRGGRANPPIPEAYFGNCVTTCFVAMKRGVLIGEEGFFIATKSIGDTIARMFRDGPFHGAERWISELMVVNPERVLFVAGSPKFRMYETDFGWGKPKKREFVSIDSTGAISVSECGNSEGGGGLEIGLSLPKNRMVAFTSMFADGLKTIRSDSK